MNYRIVNLGDYPVKIDDFSAARNSFLDELSSNDSYILWQSADEEIPLMLRRHLDTLKGIYPYYWIRRLNLHNGRFIPGWNPEYSSHLVSRRVRYVGKVHEKVEPKNPHGTIDIPIIHNHIGGTSYDSGWKAKPAYRAVLAVKKSFQAMKYGG